MDSSVCLLTRCSLISVPPFRVPATTVNTARTTRPNLRLQHASTSLPMGLSGRQPVRRLLTPVICSVEGVPTPPTNKKDDGNILIRALMAFAGTAFGALVGNFMTKQKTDNSPETSMNGSSRHGDMDQPAVAKAYDLLKLMDGEKGNTVTDKLKEMIQQNPDGSFYVGIELIKILISRKNFKAGVTIGELLEDLYGVSSSHLLGDLYLYMVLMHDMNGETEKANSARNKFWSLNENFPPSKPDVDDP